MTVEIAILVLSLVLSGFFSGVELAFISSDKLHIELLKKKGRFSGKILSRFVEKPSNLIITLLIGNNLALVVFGIYSALLLEPRIQALLFPEVDNPLFSLIVQTLIATTIIIITAEYLPKTLFLINPDRLLHLLALPIQLVYIIFFPFTWTISRLSRFTIKRVFKLDYSEDKAVFNLVDLSNLIRRNMNTETESAQDEVSTKIFTNALEFKTVRIRECMVPRTELSAISIEDDIDDLRDLFLETGHSKILVYKENIDDIIGYCHILQMFKRPTRISSLVSPIIIVPETMLANELLIQFIQENKSIALVVDEFGGTSGLVTIEDIIEEIFGEIQDEHDDEDWVEQKIDNNNFLLSARHEIDYLNDEYGLNLPEGDYDTLGGLILSVTEDIPQEGEIINIGNYSLSVISVKDTRIDIVKLTLIEAN